MWLQRLSYNNYQKREKHNRTDENRKKMRGESMCTPEKKLYRAHLSHPVIVTYSPTLEHMNKTISMSE